MFWTSIHVIRSVSALRGVGIMNGDILILYSLSLDIISYLLLHASHIYIYIYAQDVMIFYQNLYLFHHNRLLRGNR